MARILVNTRLLLKDKLDGMGWFSYETLKRITRDNPQDRFYFLFDRKYDPEFIFSDNIEPVIAGPMTRHPFLWYYWFEKVVPRIIKKTNPDLFFSPDGYLSTQITIPGLPVIHDINFLHYPNDLPLITSRYLNYYFPRFAKKAHRIITVSEYSKQDISRSYNIPAENIDVAYNGANESYGPVNEHIKAATRLKYAGGEDYFMFVGSLVPRKNVNRLLQAYEQFRKTTKHATRLVIVGSKMFKTSDIEKTYQNHSFKKDITFTGRISALELMYVMGSALALVFVPYFEGFGIPVIEAMYCRVPVIASNVTSMPEIAGDAALLADPFSVTSIVGAMIKIKEDDALRNQLIARSQIRKMDFSWDKTAAAVQQSINKCLNR